MIQFPDSTERLEWVLTPWEDPYGKEWTWNEAKKRWQPHLSIPNPTWATLEGVPATFPPAEHSHDGVYQPVGSYIVEGDARLADNRDPTSHSHTESEVTEAAPYNAGTIAANPFALERTHGAKQRLHLSGGSRTMNAPSDGSEGQTLTLYITNAAGDRDLTFHTGILFPSDSMFPRTKTIESGRAYIAKLYRGPSSWLLTTFVGGY
jgi:hypothetical protein